MKYATKKLTMATTSMRRMNLIMVDECARGAGEMARSYCQARPGSGWLCAEFVNKFAIRTRFVRWRRRLSGGGTLATRAGPAVVWNAGCRVDKSCSNLDCWLASRCAGSVYDDDPFSGRCRGCHDIPYASSCRADPSVAARRGQRRAGVAGVAPAAGRPAAQAQGSCRWPPGGAGAGLLPGNRPAGKGGRLALRASDGKTALTVTSERSVNAIAQEFLKVYEALDGNQGLDARFDARLELLSVELLGPLRPALKAACVVFEITPLPAFRAGSAARGRRALVPGQADRLRPVRPSPTAIEGPAVGGPLRGLIVRDPETDPENGAGEAQRLFPASDLLHIEQADPRMFARGLRLPADQRIRIGNAILGIGAGGRG